MKKKNFFELQLKEKYRLAPSFKSFLTASVRLVMQSENKVEVPELDVTSKVPFKTKTYPKDEEVEKTTTPINHQLRTIDQDCKELFSTKSTVEELKLTHERLKVVLSVAKFADGGLACQYFSIGMTAMELILNTLVIEKMQQYVTDFTKLIQQEERLEILKNEVGKIKAELLNFRAILIDPQTMLEDTFFIYVLPVCTEICNRFRQKDGIFQEHAFFTIPILSLFIIMHLSLLSIAENFPNVDKKLPELSEYLESYPLLFSDYLKLASDQRKPFVEYRQIFKVGNFRRKRMVLANPLAKDSLLKDNQRVHFVGMEITDRLTGRTGRVRFDKIHRRSLLTPEDFEISQYFDNFMKQKFSSSIKNIENCVREIKLKT